jgi:hypothetical protein
MFGATHYRLTAAYRRFRINQIGGVERRTTSFALVAVSTFIAAYRASSGDVAISQKLLCLLIIILFGLLFDEFSFFVHFQKEI